MLVVLVSIALALPAFGRQTGSRGGGRSAMGAAISGARMGGGGHAGSGGGFQGAIGGYRGSSGGFQGARSGPRGAIGGYRGGGGFQGAVTIPRSSTGPMRGAIGGFRGSAGVLGGSASGFSFSRPSGVSSRLGSSGWFSSAYRRDFGFDFRRHHFDRDFFILSFGYPFLNLYYPFYGSFALGFGWWWPYYYPFYGPYPYYPYYPCYPYGYYPGYVYPPPYGDYNKEAPPRTSSLGDQLTMQWQRGGGLLVAWSGRAAKVKQVEFSLLDSHRQLLTLEVARRAPYRTTFASPPDEAVYLQMAVVYADGSVDSVIRRIPDTGTATGGAGYY
jgi:hypothetical protein